MKSKTYMCRACLPARLPDDLACRCILPADMDPPAGCLYPRVGYKIHPIPRWNREEVGAGCSPILEVP